MKITTKQLVETAALLAICIISQFLKNTSVYITGPIINTCLIICVLCAGLVPAVILSIITPVTSFIITGAPIMSVIPAIMPCVMIGNALLVISIYVFKDKLLNKLSANISFIVSMGIGCIVKAVFMGVVISLILVPSLLPEAMLPKLSAIQMQFSLTQLITAVIGSILAYVIWIPLKKVA